MADIKRAFPLLMLLAAFAVEAGDLERLPDSEAGFREKIEAFIKPGGNTEDALRLLEAHRFECREFENKNPVIHCLRMDEPASGAAARFYQVLIEPKGTRVKTVTPSVGRMRR